MFLWRVTEIPQNIHKALQMLKVLYFVLVINFDVICFFFHILYRKVRKTSIYHKIENRIKKHFIYTNSSLFKFYIKTLQYTIATLNKFKEYWSQAHGIKIML